jgi:hypothetical protein
MPRTLRRVAPAFTYDAGTQRYRGPGGRFVPEREIKRLMNTVAEAARRDIRALAAQLSAGEIPLDQWQSAMMGAVKNLHVSQYAAGRGGFANLTARDFGRMGAELRFQYDRLNRFALQIEAGIVAPTAIEARAAMYASAGNVSFERARRDGNAIAGMTEERRVLGRGEHCRDCLNYAARGWAPINSLPEIGDSLCIVNCLCTFQYRRKKD